MIDVTPCASRPARLAELDALRGLAALAVLLFHFTTRYQQIHGHARPLVWGVPWGHYGVQLFFVISGFVIFVTLDRTRSLSDFVIARVSRLYPAYWTAILLTTAVLWLSGRSDLLRSPWIVLANLTMLQSFLRLPAVDDVYWTLAIELTFYAVLAALWRVGGFRRLNGLLTAWLLLPWVWTYAPLLVGWEPSWLLGLLLVQAHIPYFAIGIATYRLRTGTGARGATGVILFALATVAACQGGAALAAALIVTAAILLIALRGSSPLRWPPLVWLGGISYSLYLLHQMIGYVLIEGLEARGLSPTVAVLIATTAMMLLAALVTDRIERPALRGIRRFYGRWRDRSAGSLTGGGSPRPPSPPAPPSYPES
ncbi:MAG TPA: acyltransferase [Sphingomonas sp.]|jgi:peptidoglycan/LPS O-acetylase OafA/YrhL